MYRYSQYNSIYFLMCLIYFLITKTKIKNYPPDGNLASSSFSKTMSSERVLTLTVEWPLLHSSIIIWNNDNYNSNNNSSRSLQSTYCVLIIIFRALLRSIRLINPLHQHYYYSHLTHEEMEP